MVKFRFEHIFAICCWLVAYCSLSADEPQVTLPKFATFAESKAAYDRVVTPFLQKHCISCHGNSKEEGELNLTKLDADMKSSTSGARWAMVVEKLASGEMPPKGQTRPATEQVQEVSHWALAEAKRAGKNFARRAAYANGNQVPHHLLFDLKNIPPYDGGPRIRRISPEIYAGFTTDFTKGRTTIGQPFSADGKTTFKDMGMPKIDEPVTTQLLQNALLIVDVQVGNKTNGGGAKELQPLFNASTPPTTAQMETAIQYQFNIVLRRPPTAEEKSRFVKLMQKNIADADQAVGVRYTLAAVFLLPEAIFRYEVGTGKPDAQGRVRLAPREIAFAVAYALTDKRPDAELLTAAATGGLDTDDGVAKQVRRLLEQQKTEKPRILRFFREYFGYDAASDVFKNDKDNPDHDARVLIEDTDRLIQLILERDRDVLKELLTTNQSYVAYRTAADSKKKRAEALTKFEAEKAKNPEKFKDKKPPRVGKSIYESYNLTDFPDVQPVALPTDQRAGILTQPSWLVAHSTSFDNHVIHRGKWIRERLLGGVVPDIPITVDAQLPDLPHQTLRQRMIVTQQEYCWKCHRLMNDVGYPLEQYDHFGRYRTTETVLDQEATAKNVDRKGNTIGPVLHGVPLETTGVIAFVPDNKVQGNVTNPVEYMKLLAGSEHVEQVFIRHAFRFWMGRNESPGDAKTLQQAHHAYRSQHGSMQALIVALLSSEAFLYRVPKPE